MSRTHKQVAAGINDDQLRDAMRDFVDPIPSTTPEAVAWIEQQYGLAAGTLATEMKRFTGSGQVDGNDRPAANIFTDGLLLGLYLGQRKPVAKAA